ncbi:acetyltransferase [Gimesia sp.]|uniref:acetyltransferase n=1 Tax=Gimesia sp. TaxID=2024833 RepID=UPI000C391BDC|nr:acetyltransferase [Gimesia sp.]MAX35541.1 acetyltransferase [Gimesia sp.]HAH44092.1 acetyltransferase [Planctomycetaceae bacterium]HBL42668.1 acetyltransferase [Planctomycetaceae bacterium]|tara:strand:- start:1488 stop:1937 length:450 start_codon:yes stop_codon:yes gene_type:complete
MTPSFQISNLKPADHPRALDVWEASVRATHDFLDEDTIQSLKPLVQEACLECLPVYCVRDESQAVIGFVGVESPKIEALFIDPAWRGNGIGRQLVSYAVNELGAELVDVNEQNEQALGFYQHLGFEVAHRSDVDGFGKPFPLLHLKLAE